jgi:hypothetical protein
MSATPINVGDKSHKTLKYILLYTLLKNGRVRPKFMNGTPTGFYPKCHENNLKQGKYSRLGLKASYVGLQLSQLYSTTAPQTHLSHTKLPIDRSSARQQKIHW